MVYQLDTSIYDKKIIETSLLEKGINFTEKDGKIIIKKKEDFLDIIDQYIYIYNEKF